MDLSATRNPRPDLSPPESPHRRLGSARRRLSSAPLSGTSLASAAALRRAAAAARKKDPIAAHSLPPHTHALLPHHGSSLGFSDGSAGRRAGDGAPLPDLRRASSNLALLLLLEGELLRRAWPDLPLERRAQGIMRAASSAWPVVCITARCLLGHDRSRPPAS